MKSKIKNTEAETVKISADLDESCDESKKSSGENLNIPACQILAESEKSILFNVDSNQFWIAKKFVKKNDLNDFCQKVNLYIVLNWDYTNTAGDTITGAKLARMIKINFKHYQAPTK